MEQDHPRVRHQDFAISAPFRFENALSEAMTNAHAWPDPWTLLSYGCESHLHWRIDGAREGSGQAHGEIIELTETIRNLGKYSDRIAV